MSAAVRRAFAWLRWPDAPVCPGCLLPIVPGSFTNQPGTHHLGCDR